MDIHTHTVVTHTLECEVEDATKIDVDTAVQPELADDVKPDVGDYLEIQIIKDISPEIGVGENSEKEDDMIMEMGDPTKP